MATTTDEIKEAVESLKKSMSEVKVHDSVKEEIAGAALIMECCFAAAVEVVKSFVPSENLAGTPAIELSEFMRDITLALYDSFTKRMMSQQGQVSNLNIPRGSFGDRNL